MNEHHLRLVVTLAQPAVERHTLYPSRHVGLGHTVS